MTTVRKPSTSISRLQPTTSKVRARSQVCLSTRFLESLGSIERSAAELLFERFVDGRTIEELAVTKRVATSTIHARLKRAMAAFEAAVVRDFHLDETEAALVNESSWSPEKATRRSKLIDKEIDETLTAKERNELRRLDAELDAYLERVAPLPLDALQALQKKLLEKTTSSK